MDIELGVGVQLPARDLAMGAAVGVPYGIALEKTGLTYPKIIRDQFRGKQFTMMKALLAAAGTSCAAASAMYAFGWRPLYIESRYVGAEIIGGALVGAGAYIAGAFPTTIWAQCGFGEKRSCWALMGGLAGSLAYGLVEPDLRRSFFVTGGKALLHKALGQPFLAVSIPLTAAIGAGLYYFDFAFPEARALEEETVVQSVMSQPLPTTPPDVRESLLRTEARPLIEFLSLRRWDPITGGIIMGLLHVPVIAIARRHLSSTTTFSAVVGHCVSAISQPNSYFWRKVQDNHSLFQVAFDMSVAFGSYLAVKHLVRVPKQRPKRKVTTEAKAMAFFGGFMLLFGAGMSRAGPLEVITGIAHLSIPAMMGLVGVFGGGMLAATMLPEKFEDELAVVA
jgi:hypothetical protein